MATTAVTKITFSKSDRGTDCGQPYAVWTVLEDGKDIGFIEAEYDYKYITGSSYARTWYISGYTLCITSMDYPAEQLTTPVPDLHDTLSGAKIAARGYVRQFQTA